MKEFSGTDNRYNTLSQCGAGENIYKRYAENYSFKHNSILHKNFNKYQSIY